MDRWCAARADPSHLPHTKPKVAFARPFSLGRGAAGEMPFSLRANSPCEQTGVESWLLVRPTGPPPGEVKLLRGRYEFDRFGDQIRHAEDVGSCG
jgi:hypothetical protein